MAAASLAHKHFMKIHGSHLERQSQSHFASDTNPCEEPSPRDLLGNNEALRNLIRRLAAPLSCPEPFAEEPADALAAAEAMCQGILSMPTTKHTSSKCATYARYGEKVLATVKLGSLRWVFEVLQSVRLPGVGRSTQAVELAPSFPYEEETLPCVVGTKYGDSFVGICEVQLGGATGVACTNHPDQHGGDGRNLTTEVVRMVHDVRHATALATLCTHCLRIDAADHSTCSRCQPAAERRRASSTFTSPSPQRRKRGMLDAVNECAVLDAERKIVAVPTRVTYDLTIARGTRSYYIAVCGNNWTCKCGALKTTCAASPRCAVHHPPPKRNPLRLTSVLTTAQG